MMKGRRTRQDDMLALAEHCRKLGNGEISPVDKKNGLCREMCTFLTRECCWWFDRPINGELDIWHDLEIDVRQWELFDGNEVGFPVPSEKYLGVVASSDAYMELPKWDRRTNYGKNRLKFCLWIADQLELMHVWYI